VRAARGWPLRLHGQLDAAAADQMSDPQALISALESQVAAMKDRLESMYATARDLIAFDDVDAALARVTERAATAVRAPQYLLAARLNHTDYVHHRGFVDEDPDAVARALLAGELDDDDESRLIVEVASARRRYGWLMAASPTQSFFAQERDCSTSTPGTPRPCWTPRRPWTTRRGGPTTTT